jgi:hypothetical protein
MFKINNNTTVNSGTLAVIRINSDYKILDAAFIFFLFKIKYIFLKIDFNHFHDYQYHFQPAGDARFV